MGFFSSIAKIGGSILGGIGRAVGILPPAVAAAAPIIRRAAPLAAAAIGGGLIGSAVSGGGVAAGAAGMISVTNPATGEVSMIGRGNGLRTTITQVMSIDNATGQVVSSKLFSGAPAIMQKEVAAMKRATKKARRIHSKIGTRTVKPSRTAMIKDAIEDKMLHLAQRASALPAPCPA